MRHPLLVVALLCGGLTSLGIGQDRRPLDPALWGQIQLEDRGHQLRPTPTRITFTDLTPPVLMRTSPAPQAFTFSSQLIRSGVAPLDLQVFLVLEGARYPMARVDGDLRAGRQATYRFTADAVDPCQMGGTLDYSYEAETVSPVVAGTRLPSVFQRNEEGEPETEEILHASGAYQASIHGANLSPPLSLMVYHAMPAASLPAPSPVLLAGDTSGGFHGNVIVRQTLAPVFGLSFLMEGFAPAGASWSVDRLSLSTQQGTGYLVEVPSPGAGLGCGQVQTFALQAEWGFRGTLDLDITQGTGLPPLPIHLSVDAASPSGGLWSFQNLTPASILLDPADPSTLRFRVRVSRAADWALASANLTLALEGQDYAMQCQSGDVVSDTWAIYEAVVSGMDPCSGDGALDYSFQAAVVGPIGAGMAQPILSQELESRPFQSTLIGVGEEPPFLILTEAASAGGGSSWAMQQLDLTPTGTRSYAATLEAQVGGSGILAVIVNLMALPDPGQSLTMTQIRFDQTSGMSVDYLPATPLVLGCGGSFHPQPLRFFQVGSGNLMDGTLHLELDHSGASPQTYVVEIHVTFSAN